MSLTAIKDQFKLRAPTFDNSARWVTDERLLDIHRKLAEISNGDLILDVCCGTGIVGKRLSRTTATTVVGLDISPYMLCKAKEKGLKFCINGQTERLPFLDDIFDVVVCRQAFHFLVIERVIKEIFRVTKRGNGRIIISQIVPFGKEDSRWLYKIHRKKQPLLKGFLTENKIKGLLRNAGCVDIVSQEYLLEEPIDDWLKDAHLPKNGIEEVKKMFLHAPPAYKILHRTKVVGGKIFDTMRWVVIKGKKI